MVRRDSKRRGEPRVDRKMLQLCAQIRRVIDMTLVGDCDDEVLQNMSVRSVEPVAGSRVQVIFDVNPPGDALEKAEVLARLETARPLFVREIAQSVSRRSVPELSFWVVRAGDGDPAELDSPSEAD